MSFHGLSKSDFTGGGRSAVGGHQSSVISFCGFGVFPSRAARPACLRGRQSKSRNWESRKLKWDYGITEQTRLTADGADGADIRR